MAKLAVFIDADNFSDCIALDHAMKAVQDLGAHIVFKHAYGNAHSLKAIEAVLATYGIRPVSNLVVGKTTTDVALAIGAIEAVCRNPDIRIAVICSGDADFAPLAIRLEELGCKAICIGRHGHIFRSADAFYDEVISITVSDITKAPVQVVQALPAFVPSAIAEVPLLASTAVTQSALVAKASPPQTATPRPTTVSVQQVLRACPALQSGEWQPMSVVVRALRETKTIGAKTALQQWLSALKAHFEVELTAGKKNQIRYKKPKPPTASTALKTALTAQHLLQVCPELANQQWVALGMVVKGLREQQHISKNTKIKGWLAPLESSFEWQPSTAPNQIRWRGH